MINLITSEDVTEVEPHVFIADASDFGWCPAYFPERIHTTLGNGQDMVPTYSNDAFTKFSQVAGCVTLTIFHT